MSVLKLKRYFKKKTIQNTLRGIMNFLVRQNIIYELTNEVICQQTVANLFQVFQVFCNTSRKSPCQKIPNI